MTEGKHIFFVETLQPLGRKTKVWRVKSKGLESTCLGVVKWFPRWRCYGFFPEMLTVFEKVCLRDLAQFCEEKTEEHKRAKRESRKSLSLVKS